jgi:hypothetical protein
MHLICKVSLKKISLSIGKTYSLLKGFIALGRYGEGEEIASFVAYLASPEASFITGASLNIDGGLFTKEQKNAEFFCFFKCVNSGIPGAGFSGISGIPCGGTSGVTSGLISGITSGLISGLGTGLTSGTGSGFTSGGCLGGISGVGLGFFSGSVILNTSYFSY